MDPAALPPDGAPMPGYKPKTALFDELGGDIAFARTKKRIEATNGEPWRVPGLWRSTAVVAVGRPSSIRSIVFLPLASLLLLLAAPVLPLLEAFGVGFAIDADSAWTLVAACGLLWAFLWWLKARALKVGIA